jgi:SAM-dependent methyltransferase
LFSEKSSVLHFAPEPSIRSWLAAKVERYDSADIKPGRAKLCLDIEKIDVLDETYDAVVAFCVLEFVNDILALHEMFRVLKPGGSIILLLPVIESWERTHEIVATPKFALHSEKRRYYGRDVRERIQHAGFQLCEYRAIFQDCFDFGLVLGETIFVGRRPVA